MHNPSLPLLHKTERLMVRRGTPPSSGTLQPLSQLSAGPLVKLSPTECETCCEPPEGGRRKPTPDLLELSSRYSQQYSRTQSGPALPSRPARPAEPLRPWSDTARLLPAKPRQLEPLVVPAPVLAGRESLVIPRQRGLTGLHLSCNYSATNNRTVLEPIANTQKLQEEDTTL